MVLRWVVPIRPLVGRLFSLEEDENENEHEREDEDKREEPAASSPPDASPLPFRRFCQSLHPALSTPSARPPYAIEPSFLLRHP